MKRLFAFILALLMLAILVSCGETPVAPTEAVTEPTTAVTTPTEATTAATEPVATEPPHVHAYTVLSHDETGHWYECPDDGEKTEVEAHIWNEGTVTKEPTYSEGGEKTYVCSVCGEVKIEQTPKITAVSVKEVDCEPKTKDGLHFQYTVTYEIKLSNGESKKFRLLFKVCTLKTEAGYVYPTKVYTNMNFQESVLPRVMNGSDLVASFELLDSDGNVFFDCFESWAKVTGVDVFDSYIDFNSNKIIKYEGKANAVMYPNAEKPIALRADDFPDDGCTIVFYLRDPETFEYIEGATITSYVTYDKVVL